MKRLYIAFALIVLLSAFAGYHVFCLSTLANQVTEQLAQAQEQVDQEHWEDAIQITRQAKEQWTAREWYLHTTLHHNGIDAILISFDETLAFLEGEEHQPAEYAAANARLITQIELLKEAELPSLKNLL